MAMLTAAERLDMCERAMSDVVIIGARSAYPSYTCRLGKSRPDLEDPIIEAPVGRRSVDDPNGHSET